RLESQRISRHRPQRLSPSTWPRIRSLSQSNPRSERQVRSLGPFLQTFRTDGHQVGPPQLISKIRFKIAAFLASPQSSRFLAHFLCCLRLDRHIINRSWCNILYTPAI